jgi:hypothetical protein
MTCDLRQLGTWDVVLYLGVLYHMEDPLTALLGALRAAGFASARATSGPSPSLLDAPGGPHHYRLTAHAAK